MDCIDTIQPSMVDVAAPAILPVPTHPAIG